MRADNVIVIDDDGDKVQVEVPAPEAPSLPIKVEHEDIPQDPEESDEPALRMGHTEQSVETVILSYDEGTPSQGRWFR